MYFLHIVRHIFAGGFALLHETRLQVNLNKILKVVQVKHSLSQSGQAIYSLHPSTLAQWHSTVIIAAAELLLITKKETSYERGENPTPYVWDIYAKFFSYC